MNTVFYKTECVIVIIAVHIKMHVCPSCLIYQDA